jgi:hypothetical protein
LRFPQIEEPANTRHLRDRSEGSMDSWPVALSSAAIAVAIIAYGFLIAV